MDIRFDRYFDNDELAGALAALAAEHPGYVRVEVAGRSHEGREIAVVTVTDFSTGPDTEKPAFWLDGNIHATEIAGTTACLYTIHALLARREEERTARLLARMAFYVMPRMNPDGAALALATPTHYVRSGVRAYPYPEEDDGLHPGDVDGDGRILEMRIKDPAGPWKALAADPRVLVPRGPDEEEGEFYRVFPEGSIRNYDGFTVRMARPLQGLDFNRNFPLAWEGEGTQRGAGPFPLSEPETRAAAEFIVGHPNITGAITYHTYGGIHLRPLSIKPDDDIPTDDLWVYKAIGRRATEITGYPAVSTYHDFRYHPKELTTGAFDDWCYAELGIFAWTTELWDLVGRATGKIDRNRIDWYRAHPEEDDLAIARWLDENAPGSLVDWYPFEHPQLGPVELGGQVWLKTVSNPPEPFLEAEVAMNHEFVLAQAAMGPWLRTVHAGAQPLGGELWRVVLVVENAGFLSTSVSVRGRERKAARPVRVELEGCEVVSGRPREEVGHLEGRSNKLDWTADSSTDNRFRREWVVRAAAGTVAVAHVRSDRAGTIHVDIPLG